MKAMLPAAAALALVCASCAPSTPDARIAAQPALFDGLPASQRELVRQGRIDKGMGTDAVYLAWGRPSREFDGGNGGVPTLRWDYTGTTPVFSTHSFGGFGRHGRTPYYGIGPEVIYVPYRRATVLFSEGRVTSWERSR